MKSLFIILSVFILTLIYSSTKADAACPSGYTSMTFSYPIGGCVVWVTYCHSITPFGNRHAFIESIQFNPTGPCTTLDIQNSTFWDNLRDEIIKNLHSNSAFPPCEEGRPTMTVLIENAGCWGWFDSITTLGLPPGDLELVRINYPCEESATCKVYYSVCRNPVSNELVIIENYSVPSEGNECNNEPVIHTNEMTGLQYSDCFIVCE